MINTKMSLEKEYLNKVLNKLNKEIEEKHIDLDKYKEKIETSKKYVWSGENIDIGELISIKNDVIVTTNTSKTTEKKIISYIKMLSSAYFARIDFKESNYDEVDKIYIGINTLKEDNLNILVYDWRTPIASMYYDSEPGYTSFIAPGGKIDGDMILKRQFEINKDQIKKLFDTDIEVIDDVLQDILSDNKSNHMRDIIKTIQKEQNSVIRENKAKTLIVQGPAGSGKTSVALHRTAYLLYAEREKLKNANILIFSPNEIFSEYISKVLPDLGEENIQQTTFKDYIETFSSFKVTTSLNDVYEILFSNCNNTIKKSIEYKFSHEFLQVIDKYCEKIENKIEVKNFILNNEIIVSKKEIMEFRNEYLMGLDVCSRMERIIDKIISLITSKCPLTDEMKEYEKVSRMLVKKMNAKSLFKDLFTEENLKTLIDDTEIINMIIETSKDIQKNKLTFEESVLFLYFKGKLKGFQSQHTIKHVVIDEAQDYTEIQFQILKSVFKNADFTIVGDLNQSIFPFSRYKDYKPIKKIFVEGESEKLIFKELTKTYRSTVEINTFSKKILKSRNKYNQIDRHGEEPGIYNFENEEEMNNKIKDDALKQAIDYKTVAIICKNAKQCNNLYEKLAIEHINTITKENEIIRSGINIIPSYLSKGLEFDCVLIYNANEDTYKSEERNLFYVCCTRALHRLNIYINGKHTKFLEGI